MGGEDLYKLDKEYLNAPICTVHWDGGDHWDVLVLHR